MDSLKSVPLSSFIRERREARGWDQPELARRLGSTQQSVSRWESGAAVPRTAVLKKLSESLDTPYQDIIEMASSSRQADRSIDEGSAVVGRPALMSTLPFDLLSEDQFEHYAVAYFSELYPSATVYRNGGRGHKQNGIDVFVDRPDAPRIGIQCKRVTTFGPTQAQAVIDGLQPSENIAEPILMLSRPASPSTRSRIRENPPWAVLGADNLSEAIRRLSGEAQLRLVSRFFPGLQQSFLGIGGPSPWLSASEYRRPLDVDNGIFSQQWDLVGRLSDLKRTNDFLSSDSGDTLVLSSPAGSGKTRLLLAIADDEDVATNYAVRFLAPGTELSPEDFALLPNEPLLLIVDDAHQRSDLALIVRDALRNGSTKFLLSTRTQNLDVVREQLRSVGRDVRPEVNLYGLDPISFGEAETLARQVLQPDFRNESTVRSLAAAGMDAPFLIVVAGQLINQGQIKSLLLAGVPEIRVQILDEFRRAMLGGGSQPEVDLKAEILNVIAAVQPFRSEQDTFCLAAEQLAGRKYRHIAVAIGQLLDAGILIRRGSVYRITPDLLGDVVLARALVDENSGRATGYADELVKVLPDDVLEQALVNVSRVDAVLQSAAPGTDSVVMALWRPFRKEIEAADWERRVELARLLARVAYYQPALAVEAAEWMILNPIHGPIEEPSSKWFTPADNASVRRALLPTLNRAAYTQEHLARAMELLKLTQLADGANYSDRDSTSPVKIMAGLIGPAVSKPYSYQEAALDLAISWLTPDASAETREMVMQVITPAVATEGSDDISDGLTITFRPFLLNPSAVGPLRRRAINAATSELTSNEAGRVASAVPVLGAALRPPIGLFGTVIDDARRAEWDDDFLATVDSLTGILRSKPPVAVSTAIRALLSGAAFRENSAVTTAVHRALAESPETLEESLSLALTGSGGAHLQTMDYLKRLEALQAWRLSLTDQLLASRSGPEPVEDLRVALELNHSLGRTGDATAFAYLLFTKSPDLAALACDEVSRDPDSALRALIGTAIDALARTDAGTAVAKSIEILSGEGTEARRLVAHALGWRGEEISQASGGSQLLTQLVTDADQFVARNGLAAVRVLAPTNAGLALGLLVATEIRGSEVVVNEMASMFDEHVGLSWVDFSRERGDYFFRELESIAKLDDYSVETLIARISTDEPERIVQLLQNRIERSERENDTNFNAIPFDFSIPIRPEDPALRTHLLGTIWDWIVSSPNSYRREHDGGKLWWGVAGPVGEESMGFLEVKIRSTSESERRLASRMIQVLPRRFVRENVDFVARALHAAAASGSDALSQLQGAFYGSVISGMRSRSIGSADEQDVLEVKEFLAISADLRPGSVEREFYESMARTLKERIDRDLAEDRSLADRHDW